MVTTATMSRDERRWSLAAAGWTGVILASIPLVRVLQRAVVTHLGSDAFGWAVVGVVVVATATVLALRRRKGARRGAAAAALGAALLALAWTASLWSRPEEAVHLVEYGVLAVLVQRTFRARFGDRSCYPAAVAAVLFVGVVDEVIQWMTPGRFFDLRDVALNGGAAALVQVVLWRLDPPSLVAPRWGRRGLRAALRLALLDLALLLLCSVATPARLDALAARLPWLDHLAHNESVIVEYGHRHVFPGLGEFSSRLTLAELHTADATRAASTAALLDRFRGGRRYREFLLRWPASRDPFAHEARVHVHSRDVHLGLAMQQRDDPDALREHATAAFREQQILETFFGRTLAASRSHLEPRRRQWLERHADPDATYVSRAGGHLVTWISEEALVTILLASIAGLGLLLRRLS
jgi:hypothetical protein